MSQTPSTPVKVPSSAANYTAATLDPDIRSQINHVLLQDGHINKIQESILHSLNAHPSNWTTTVQSHALSLLRSGEITTFPALLKRVLEDIQEDTNKTATANGNGKTANGDKQTNGAGEGAGEGASSLALPEEVREEAFKVTKECLDEVCELS